MLEINYTTRFKRDVKLIKKRNKDTEKLKTLIKKLANEEELEARYCDHSLVGNYKGRRECHIEPDWLLIYKKEPKIIILERTGSHSDLFK